jgi:type II secretory pathway component PulM
MSGWWHGRSQREQMLVAIAGGLTFLVFFWLGVLRPLAAAGENAEARHQAAVASHGAMRARIDAAKALAATPATALGAPLPDYVRAAAGQAGFGNAAVDSSGNGRVRLAIPSAKAVALFALIDGLEAHGVFVEQASLRANSDATLAVDATLAARGE